MLFIAAAIALVIVSARGWPIWALIGLAGVAGATAPPVGALSAARWRKVVGSTDRLRSALSLEGSLNDVTFLVGPVLVTTVSATAASWCGLLVAAVLVAAGMVGLLTARVSEPAPAGPSAGFVVDRRLVSSRFVSLFVANLAMGLFFGGVPVTVTAFALAHGAGALAGPIAAGSSVISLIAGLVYGGTQRGKPLTIMTIVSVIVTIGAALLALVPNVPVMFVGYGLVGGCVALILIPASVLLQKATASEVYTQAMTWINSASAIGIAAAAPLVGYLIQSHDWTVGFLATAALTAFLPLTLLLTRPVLIPLQHESVSTDADG